MRDGKVCLKWNDFQDLAQVSFGELRIDTDFTDVTLACDDQSVKAHKVVLSACSPFFKKLLKTHPHPQPLIYMKGMKASSLAAIVDFLYLGEVSVLQKELDSFLALAGELQLKGLDGNSEEKVQEQPPAVLNHIGMRANMNDEQSMPKLQISTVKFERGANLAERAMMMTKAKPNSIIEPSTLAKIDSMIEKLADRNYCCTNCGYISKHPGHIREHVEKHIEGLEYPCNFCNKVMKSSHSFREHKRYCSPKN